MKIKKTAWFILLSALWLPLLQATFGIWKNTFNLKGAFVNHQEPSFSDTLWLEGTFQKNYEEYLNDSIGFHNDLIALRNQIDYSLFNKCHSFDIEVGKNGYLVATSHMDFHLGKVRVRDSKIDSIVHNLTVINDALIKAGKNLIVIFAPSKGAYNLNESPVWYNTQKSAESDYERLVKKLRLSNVRSIDFNAWFLSKKQTSEYKLFPKCGIHWSTYGAFLAGDSLVKYIESISQSDLPDVINTGIELSDSARNTDADLADALNLIYEIPNGSLAYPKLNFNKTSKAKRNVLFVGDSFFYTLGRIPNEVFNEYSFWYYNSSIFSNGSNNGKKVAEINLSEEIQKHNDVILIATETNLGNLGWGFLENAAALYSTNINDRMEFYRQKIKNDPVWYATVLEKAKAKNISVEEQLDGDARYAMSLEKN